MPHDAQKYLHDMLGACEFLIDFTSDRSIEDLRKDRAFRSAVERELQIIGEALMQLDRVHPQVSARVSDKQNIIGFRHVLVHGYDNLDPRTVWSVIASKLGPLREELRRLLCA